MIVFFFPFTMKIEVSIPISFYNFSLEYNHKKMVAGSVSAMVWKISIYWHHE
jgi:hypothetical protein